MFQISDDDFQELIKIIDPEHTGHLSYNEFLNLFEKDSVVSSITNQLLYLYFFLE